MKLSLLRGRALAPCFALAVFSALSLASYFELFQANGFLFLACFLLFGAASGLRATRRERVVFALLSLLFSFMRVAGRSYDLYDSHVLLMKNAASMLHAAAAMAALFFCAFSGFLLLHRLVCGLLIPAPEQEKRMPEGRFFASLVFILILQAFAFVTAAGVFSGLKRSTEPVSIRLKKLENADLFLDLPLYFGLLGTVASFIVMSFNPNISRLIAYSSTLVGIIFSVILRLTLQYPLKQSLICASAEPNGKESEQ